MSDPASDRPIAQKSQPGAHHRAAALEILPARYPARVQPARWQTLAYQSRSLDHSVAIIKESSHRGKAVRAAGLASPLRAIQVSAPSGGRAVQAHYRL